MPPKRKSEVNRIKKSSNLQIGAGAIIAGVEGFMNPRGNNKKGLTAIEAVKARRKKLLAAASKKKKK